MGFLFAAIGQAHFASHVFELYELTFYPSSVYMAPTMVCPSSNSTICVQPNAKRCQAQTRKAALLQMLHEHSNGLSRNLMWWTIKHISIIFALNGKCVARLNDWRRIVAYGYGFACVLHRIEGKRRTNVCLCDRWRMLLYDRININGLSLQVTCVLLAYCAVHSDFLSIVHALHPHNQIGKQKGS